MSPGVCGGHSLGSVQCVHISRTVIGHTGSTEKAPGDNQG
ncbi:rCG22240 [Rattus norvegicus]|uniref:RCG22240 n=1 Tax=Rattus norvegicus TaxID=10116 RepID=A6INJ9_RAT|nr:rCG22240 [Rattus norvegicus]